MLECRFGYPPIARTPQIKSAKPLRQSALNSGALRILLGEGPRLFAFAGRLERSRVGFRTNRERASFGAGTLLTKRAGHAISHGEFNLNGRVVIAVDRRRPTQTVL